MFQEILDLPIIVQGALGSFLFWVVFTVVKKASEYLWEAIGNFNKSWKEEALEFEQLQSQYMIGSGEAKINFILIAIYGAFNRVLQGLIYLCLGLVVNSLVFPFGIIGYIFAIIFLVRALQAIPFTVSDGKSLEWHRSRVGEIQAQLDALRQQH